MSLSNCTFKKSGFMTVVIKRSDSKEEKQQKINRLQRTPLKSKQKSFMKYCGALKGVFKEDAVAIQRKLRDEWP